MRKLKQEVEPKKLKPKSPTPYAFCPLYKGQQLHLAICQVRCGLYDGCAAREEAEVALMMADLPHNFSG